MDLEFRRVGWDEDAASGSSPGRWHLNPEDWMRFLMGMSRAEKEQRSKC